MQGLIPISVSNIEDDFQLLEMSRHSQYSANIAMLNSSKSQTELDCVENAEFQDEIDEKREFHQLLKLAHPIVVTYVLEYLPELVCIMLVGHINSPEMQKFVDGAMLSIMWMEVSALAVGFGLSSALDTLCSQAFGAKQFHKIGIYLQCGMLVISACFPVFIFNWYSEIALKTMGIDTEIAKYAGEFSRYTVFGLPALFGYEMVRKVLHAQYVTSPIRDHGCHGQPCESRCRVLSHVPHVHGLPWRRNGSHAGKLSTPDPLRAVFRLHAGVPSPLVA